MQREANKWANAITDLGIEKADRVFFFTDRIPELYFAIFGTLKRGAIMAPLFAAFGPDAVAERIRRAEGVMVVTTPNLLPKIDEIRGDLPSLEHVVVIGHRQGVAAGEGNLDYLEMTERRLDGVRERADRSGGLVGDALHVRARRGCPRARRTCTTRCWGTTRPGST